MLSALTALVALVITIYLVEFFRKPKCRRKCEVNTGLKHFKKIICIYPVNAFRDKTLMKEWNVAVITADPDVRFEHHDAWMLHIMLERISTLAFIAELENIEMRQAINAYKERGIANRSTIKQNI